MRPMDQRLQDQLLRLRAAAGGGPPGFSPTRLKAVQVFWSGQPIPLVPLTYDPGIAVIVSGRKIGFLDGARFVYGTGSYLAVGLPVCFDCETEATLEQPLIGLFLRADPVLLHELARDLADTAPDRAQALGPVTLGVEPLQVPDAMADAVARLASQLGDEAQARLLAPATLREVFFHALQDRHGRVLLAQTRPDRPEARIATLLRRVERQACAAPRVEEMAAQVGMSPATFHRHFRAAFGAAPLQYLRKRRLLRARTLLLEQGMGVAEAAHAAGYATAAQFSLDFRARFGLPPSAARSAAGQGSGGAIPPASIVDEDARTGAARAPGKILSGNVHTG